MAFRPGDFYILISLGFVSGKKAGEKGVYSLRINLGNYLLHIHHWLVASVILITNLFFHFLPASNFTAPFLIGIAFQGIVSYDDRFKFLMKLRGLTPAVSSPLSAERQTFQPRSTVAEPSLTWRSEIRRSRKLAFIPGFTTAVSCEGG